MAALSALVSGLDAELVRLGYKDSTMVWYRGCWRRVQRYFAARGVKEFSLDVAMEWVDEACGFFAKEQAGTLKQTDVYLFRVAQMLGEYETHGAVLRRYSRTVSKLTGDGAIPVDLREAALSLDAVIAARAARADAPGRLPSPKATARVASTTPTVVSPASSHETPGACSGPPAGDTGPMPGGHGRRGEPIAAPHPPRAGALIVRGRGSQRGDTEDFQHGGHRGGDR